MHEKSGDKDEKTCLHKSGLGVASQREELYPPLEFNSDGGRQTLEQHMQPLPDGRMAMTLSQEPGIWR